MKARSRVLIFGATGMLGHKLAQVLSASADVVIAVRGASRWPDRIPVVHIANDLDVRKTDQLAHVLDTFQPDFVLNAAGLVKQSPEACDSLDTFAVNALFPNVLALLCESRAIRLVHYSTDCVFSGAREGKRGSHGYRELDPPDSRDAYGLSKLLGEPSARTTLVLRTSIIGHELRGFTSLLEWFLAQGSGPVSGFTNALFTGLTTLELSRVTSTILRSHAGLSGLWHVSAPPITKHDLLGIVKDCYRRNTVIKPQSEFYCDRRLDGTRFSETTGWQAPAWPEMIEEMRNDFLLHEGAGNMDTVGARRETA